MAKHALNPSPDEVWFHPLTFNAYRIHSITDDGWTRYYTEGHKIPLYTMPTLDFVNKYKKQVNK